MDDNAHSDDLYVRCREVIERTTVYRIVRAAKWHTIEVVVICVAAWEQRKGKA